MLFVHFSNQKEMLTFLDGMIKSLRLIILFCSKYQQCTKLKLEAYVTGRSCHLYMKNLVEKLKGMKRRIHSCGRLGNTRFQVNAHIRFLLPIISKMLAFNFVKHGEHSGKALMPCQTGKFHSTPTRDMIYMEIICIGCHPNRPQHVCDCDQEESLGGWECSINCLHTPFHFFTPN